MKDERVERATVAASFLARDQGLVVSDAVVIQSSNTLSLRLLPCDVFARVAVRGQEVAALEVRLASGLAAVGAPIASLEPRVEPGVHERDGFAVTFWSYHAPTADAGSPVEYAVALRRLHGAMRRVDIVAPHFTDRAAAAEELLGDRQATPALGDDDRRLLIDTLRTAGRAIGDRATADQLLHGEPHPGNVLRTSEGMLFVDLETCCRGPVELDVAHVPDEVSLLYPDLDPALLQECRRLVLALVATWRWDVRDEFPDGHRHAVRILHLLRAGPPWPALGALTGD